MDRIIGVAFLALFVFPALFGCSEPTEEERFGEKAEAIEQALLEFHRLYDRFPAKDEGLVVVELPPEIVVGIIYTPTDDGVTLTAPKMPGWSHSISAR